MNIDKIRATCRIVRIGVGALAIAYGIFTVVTGTPNYWFFAGVAPLVAGIINFCPLCLITKKCDLPES